MQKNKVVSLLIALSMTCSLISPIPATAVSVNSAGITQADTALEYSMGTLKAGSYLGYGYEDKANYANQTELEAAGYTITGPTYGALLFTDGKPTLNKTASGSSFAITGVAPDTDKNGIALPDGVPMYTQVQYSLTKVTAANAFITLGMAGNAGSGQTQIHNGTSKATGNGIAMQHGTQSTGGGTESYKTISNFYNANDMISVRALFELGGAEKNHMWIWAWNDDNGIPKEEPQANSLFPRYGQVNTRANGFKFEMNKDTADGQIKVHNVKVYEKYEMFFRDAVSKVESNMLGSNASLNLVQSNLNLPTQVTGLDFGETASITWASSNTSVVENNGTVHFNELVQESVKLTGTYTIGDKTKTIVYDVFVQEIPTDDKQIDNAMSKLTWDMLSSQSQAKVSQNLTLPNSIANNYGSVVPITWSVVKGADNVTISGSTAVITMSETEPVNAAIRATFTYGSLSNYVDFDFTIPVNEVIYFANTDFTQKGNADITDADGIAVISSRDEDSWVKFVSGNGLRANGNNSKTATASVDLEKMVEKKGYLNEWKSLESDITYEFEVNTEALSTSVVYETQALLKNASGKMITFLQFTGGNRSTGGASGTINIKQNNVWSNGITLDPNFINRYRAAFADGVFPKVSVKVIYNRMSTEYDVYLKLPNDADYSLFFRGALPTESGVSAGDHAANITITTTTNTSRASAINLHNAKIYTTKDSIIEYVTKNITESMLLDGQDKTNIRKSLASSVMSGTNLTWQVVSSNYNGKMFDEKGTLLVKLSEGEEYEVVVKPVITFTGEKFANFKIPTDNITIKVSGYDDTSLAYGKKISLSGAAVASGSSVENINDGTSANTFLTTGTEESFSFVIDLTAKTLFSDIIIREGHDVSYNIASYTIEGSDNKKTWVSLTSGNGIGDKAHILLVEPYAQYRYVKFTVVSKITKNKPVSIGEFMMNFNPSEKYKHMIDFENLENLPISVSDNFYIQGLGSVYGSQIVWTNSDSNVLSVASTLVTDTNSAHYGKYKVTYAMPDRDTNVTFTATVGSEIKKYTVTAKGKNTSGGSTSGGGGSKGTSSSTGVVTYTPSETQPVTPVAPTKTGKHYYDLDRVAWAIDYIDTLTDRGIVSGDGTGNFYPTNHITREEFTKMLVLSLGIAPDYETKISFADLDANHWAYPYIAAAYANGIINGVSDNSFGIGSKILRQDMAVMAVRGMKATGNTLDESKDESFADGADVDSYAIDSVLLAKAMGLLSGDELGRFLPKNNATRAESAKILHNIAK